METVELLDKYFETAFAAPDGTKRLRELILTLAMQGKLVPKNPQDRPASELLKEIEAEKKRLIKEKKIKKSKPIPEITPNEIPYDLPKGWEWVKLGKLTTFKIGKTPASKNPIYWSELEGKNWSSIGDLPSRGYLKSTKKKITQQAIDDVFKSEPVPIGTLLMSFKLSIGKTAITKIPTYHNEAIISFPYLLPELKMYLFWSLNVITNTGDQKNAIKGNTLNSESLNNLLVALPPLEEQHRIVKKIDRLEKLKTERDRKQLFIHAAASDRLLNAPDKNSFNDAWNFIQNNFNQLYSVQENISELRKAILQLAVMGKLVPQDPNDPPASELLKEIEAEKKRLIKEKKIKKQKPLPEITLEEFCYEIPKGWELIRFGNLAMDIATGPFGLMIKKSEYIQNGIPLINPSHMVNGKIIHDPNITVSHQKALELSTYQLFEGDIVMARRGEMGRCAIVDSISHNWLCGTGSFILRFTAKINRQYIFNLFRSENIKSYLGGNSVGTTMTNLNHGILKKMPVLLPPLPEQHRIVAKVDRLMALCDELEAQLTNQTEKQTALLNEIVATI